MVLFLTMIERKNTALNLTKERTMAEVDTVMLSKDHADIRREGADHTSEIRYDVATRAGDLRQEVAGAACDLSKLVGSGISDVRHEIATTMDTLNDAIRVEGGNTRAQSAAETNEIVKEGLKGDFNTRGDIKDTRFDLADRVGSSADRIVDRIGEHDRLVAERFFAVGRDTQDIRANMLAQQQQLVAGFLGTSKDIELNALKTQLDSKANTQYLADKIVNDGEKTRALMNDLKYHDLNRALVERQTALVNCEQDNRHWGHRYDDARWNQMQGQWGTQFAAMQSQLQSMSQNFNSQLSEARQGMVNFGTMAGVGQTSTNNNVR
jgi:hypothetical protein